MLNPVVNRLLAFGHLTISIDEQKTIIGGGDDDDGIIVEDIVNG